MRPDLDAATVARHIDAQAAADARGPPAVGVAVAAALLVAVVALVLQTPGDDEVALGTEVMDVTFASLDAELRCGRGQGCVRWSVPIEEAWRSSAALARVGDVVVGATATRLVAWELTTGEQAWERDLAAGDDPGRALLRIDDELVLVDTGRATHVLDATDGRVLGTVPLEGTVRRAVADGTRVRLAWLRDGGAEGVGVYDLAGQTWLWERDLEVHALEPAIVAEEDGGPVALDPATGERRLGFEHDGGRLAVVEDAIAVQVEGEVQLRALADGRLRAAVPGSLQPLLSPWTMGAAVPSSEPLLVVDAEVQRAVDAHGRLQWERAPEDGTNLPTRISRIGAGLLHVHGREDEGGQPLLDAATGEERARVPTEVVERGAPTALRAASPSTLIVEAMGRTVAYDLRHDRELWSVARGLPRGHGVLAADHDLAIVADPSRLLALEVP